MENRTTGRLLVSRASSRPGRMKIIKLKIAHKLLMISGLLFGLNFAGCYFSVWLQAYQHKYQVIVTVNQSGEARLELLVFPVMMIIMVVSLVTAIAGAKKI
jgi:hypothetical protein